MKWKKMGWVLEHEPGPNFEHKPKSMFKPEERERERREKGDRGGRR